MVLKKKLSQTLERMFSLHPKLIDFDLSRLKFLMNKFGNPENQLKNVIHIAGTNGKGSTASFLKEILEAHELTVNVYTSPHLINFNERIRIRNKLISDELLINILENIELENKNKPITFFEITTAAALIAFQKYKSDFNIIETGLGGRLDATNIIDKKRLCIITKIGFDHTEFLGKKIKQIAFEKSGILRENVPVIIAKQKYKDALETILDSASKINAKVINIENISASTKIGLNGNHQYENATSAYTAAKELLPSISSLKTQEAVKKVSWHGRIEKVERGKIVKDRKNLTILDGSHNQDGAYVLNQYLNQTPLLKWNLIIGMLNNRDIEAFVNIFKQHLNRAYAIAIPNIDNSHKPNDISLKLNALGIETHPMKNLEQALRYSDKKMPLLITGSLYLAGHVLKFNNTQIV